MTSQQQQIAEPERVKLVIVGDGTVGKTSLLLSYTSNAFPTDYVPTVFDNVCCSVSVDERVVHLSLFDTAGQEEFSRLRPLSYPGTDVFLLCFSVAMHASFHNIKNVWWPEVMHFAPNAKIVLVGTKCDLRHDDETLTKLAERGQAPLSFDDGQALAKSIGAAAYAECSALTQRGVKAAFEEALKAALFDEPKLSTKRKQKCNLL